MSRARTLLFGGALAAVGVAAVGATIYRRAQDDRLYCFWDQVLCKLEVMLESYRTKLAAAALVGVDDATAYTIMTTHTDYKVAQENLKCHMYVVPRTDSINVLTIHIEASPALALQIQDLLFEGTSGLPIFDIPEILVGDTCHSVVVHLTTTGDAAATLVTEKVLRAINAEQGQAIQQNRTA